MSFNLIQAITEHFGSTDAAFAALAATDDPLQHAAVLARALPDDVRKRVKEGFELKADIESSGRTARASELRTIKAAQSIIDELEALVAEAHDSQIIRKLKHEGNSGRGGPNLNRMHDPFDSSYYGRDDTAQSARSRALAAVDRWPADDELRESATRTLERVGVDHADDADSLRDVRGVSEHILMYSNPLYVSAFRKWSRDPQGFVADLTPDEAQVWREAREFGRINAATLDTAGAVLPSPLDPTIVLTNVGSVDPMRGVARIDTTAALTKRYITSAGSTFSFDGEGGEVSDDTHTENEVSITVQKAQGWIEATIEAAMDQPDFSAEVAKIIADGKSRLEAEKFITGASGSGEPIGIETKLAGGASVVSPATAEVFASADVYATIEALPPRWRARARWQAELSTINQIDQFETTNGAKLFPRVGDDMPVLLRRRLHENSNMDAFSDVDTGATEANHILYAGDWKQYVILDRVGLSVFYRPPGSLMGASGRPDGRVGWYCFWRVGADVLTIDAFRVLNLATTA